MLDRNRFIHALNRPNQALRYFLAKFKVRLLFSKNFHTTELNYLTFDISRTKILNRVTVADGIEFCFETDRGLFQHNFDKREIITLSNALLNVETGLIYAEFSEGQKFRLINESTEWPNSQNVFFEAPPKNEIEKIFGSYHPSITKNGFYHLMTEDLPNALSITNGSTPIFRHQKSKLESEISNILPPNFSTDKKWLLIEEISFLARGKDVGYLHPENLRILRDNFLPKEIQNAGKGRFYISRRFSRRSLVKEELIEKALGELGFETVFAENMSLGEQAIKFSNAEIVVGAHGAGLINTIWSKDAKLVEISTSNEINRCFEWQSLICNQQYSRIFYDSSPKSITALVKQIVF